MDIGIRADELGIDTGGLVFLVSGHTILVDYLCIFVTYKIIFGFGRKVEFQLFSGKYSIF
jgi:hypothetical protein